MKKRLFFLIVSAMQIVGFSYMIMLVPEMVEDMGKMAENFPPGLQERYLSTIESGATNAMFIAYAIIGILVNAIVIYLAYKDKLLKKRGTVITCNVVAILLSGLNIIKLLAIVNIIGILSLKRERPEDMPDPKKNIPDLKAEKVDKKKIIYAVLFILFYLSQMFFYKILPENINKNVLIIGQALSYILLVLASILVFKDLYKNNIKEFKNNFKAYLLFIAKRFCVFYPIYIIGALAAMIISGEASSANQANLNNIPLLVLALLSIIYAPIVEEAVFRGAIGRLIKNDILFIIISGLAFGLMHTITQEATFNLVIIQSIPYALLGCFLAYIYKKTNNIMTNTFIHACFNTLAFILMAISK